MRKRVQQCPGSLSSFVVPGEIVANQPKPRVVNIKVNGERTTDTKHLLHGHRSIRTLHTPSIPPSRSPNPFHPHFETQPPTHPASTRRLILPFPGLQAHPEIAITQSSNFSNNHQILHFRSLTSSRSILAFALGETARSRDGMKDRGSAGLDVRLRSIAMVPRGEKRRKRFGEVYRAGAGRLEKYLHF